MSVWRSLGLTADRSKPFRARLWRWWVYALLAAVSLGMFALMVSGVGFENPDAARDVAIFIVLPLAVFHSIYAGLAWRYQQRH